MSAAKGSNTPLIERPQLNDLGLGHVIICHLGIDPSTESRPTSASAIPS